MAYGLRVVDQSGRVQISDNSFFAYHYLGALSFGSGVTQQQMSSAVSPLAAGTKGAQILYSGSTFYAAAPENSRVFLWDRTPPAPGTFGLKVVNDNGTLAFSSETLPLILVDIIDRTDCDAAAGNYVYDGSRSYVGLIVSAGYKFVSSTFTPSGFFQINYRIASVAQITGGINISAASQQTFAIGGGGGFSQQNTRCVVFVIDITGL